MKKNLRQKSVHFPKLKSWQEAIIFFFNFTLKYEIKLKYPINTFKYTTNPQKWPFPFISLNFYRKREWKCDHKRNIRQNIVCLDQQINASQEKFTQSLVVMVETFRRSGIIYLCANRFKFLKSKDLLFLTKERTLFSAKGRHPLQELEKSPHDLPF